MIVVHVITCLNDGGAEAILFRLIQELPDDNHIVVSLSGLGKYGDLLQSIGIEVIDLDMTTLGRKLSAVYRLARIIKAIVPDAIQTWMYHADFIGGAAARIAGFNNIIWGLHNSVVTTRGNPLPRYVMIRANALLSHVIPRRIISCSQTALLAHKNIGYAARKIFFIPNGYPLDTFYPDQKARLQIRTEFDVAEGEVLIAMIARFDPQKDHLNLLNALAILKQTHSFRCLLVGKGLDRYSQLNSEIETRGLGKYVLLVGQRNDIPRIMNALDICVNASFAEAFPNVLCEAMACGVPCVATDVGDSAFIVGDTGWIVPPRSPDKLAAVLVRAIAALPEPVRQHAARQRISDNFSIEKMAKAYRAAWSKETI